MILNKPLEGLKVVDLSQAWAGPVGSMLLGDFGAEIIKVEPPGVGDHVRGWTPPGCQGESAHFLAVNRNKKSITLNLKSKEGQEIFLRLVKDADVLLENFRPGVMKKFGLTYENLRPLNPRLIYCSVSGFGQTGPSRDDAAYDLILQGMGGAMSVTGEEGGQPVKPGIPQADVMGAMAAAIAILAALQGRAKAGEGCFIDVSMLDVQIMAMGFHLVLYFLNGTISKPVGTGHPAVIPYQMFFTKTFAINIAAMNPGHWADLCHLLDLSHLIEDPRFKNLEVRILHKKELLPLLEAALKKRPAEEWLPLIKAKGIPCGAINDVARVAEEPQVKHRDMILEVKHKKLGKVKIPGTPIRLYGMTGKDPVLPPPELGEHNEEIYCGRLGYAPKDLQRLKEKGVI